MNVTHNQQKHRFEMALPDERVATLEYELRGQHMTVTHTEVPKQMEGRGVGGQLARAALDFARGAGMTVVPVCPFVASYILKHPEFADVVSPDFRRRLEKKIA